MRSFSPTNLSLLGALAAVVAVNVVPPAVVPTDVQLPGTQPGQATLLPSASLCSGCHAYYDPAVEPHENWQGSMMAHAGRDPVFWAALAVAEGDYPGSGDFCIRCHSPRGWMEGRAVPSDGSGLVSYYDADGIECGICHSLVNPDGSEHPGQQSAPYIANNGVEGFYGSGMQVHSGTQDRYGPYANVMAPHGTVQSSFHRESELCGTCHDVSNPVVGDLAPNNGAQTPLLPGQFSGVPGAPVTQKAAFLNPPFAYGIVERTFSEHKASLLASTPVSSYASLPADLQRGAIKRAYEQAQLAGNGGDYKDGTTRLFSCQSCHLEPVVGQGASFGMPPTRSDLPLHDLTGGNTWVPTAIQWLDSQTPSRLRLGQGLNGLQTMAMDRGVERARSMLQRAAALDVTDDTLRVTNLTGHKLISGYPEGRRMWLRIRWMDENLQVLQEDGAYGSFTATVNGNNYTVNTITDPNARVYETKLAITQDWAQQLLTMGVDPNLPLTYDAVTGNVTMTLAQLAVSPPGTAQETFHFVLNNKVKSDTRIPPYGFDRDEAERRNALPVPATQYGNPPSGGAYDYFDDVTLTPPAGASRAEIELLYQTASWEYIQFLLLANPGTSTFLAGVGQDLFDAYMATGRSAPETMATARWCSMPGTNDDLVLKTSVNGGPLDTTCAKRVAGGDVMNFEVTSPGGTHQAHVAALFLQIYNASSPPTAGLLPGLWLDQDNGYVLIPGVPPGGWTFNIAVPAGLSPQILRWQALALGGNPSNGFFALSNAYDFYEN
ncbi:MAG TPA: hypothetical protein ENI87_11600 [bacterium]|nr:hypothetical protein [bacterium]